jgi:hypothetical protein
VPTHKSLHKAQASSITARILPETPKEAQLSVLLQNGDFLLIEISRVELKRCVASAERAMRDAPQPFRGLSKASRPATSRSK